MWVQERIRVRLAQAGERRRKRRRLYGRRLDWSDVSEPVGREYLRLRVVCSIEGLAAE